jgi:SAM-dependent methyltransferase
MDRPGQAPTDIFSGQPSDPDLLAAVYDLEHEEITEDHVFYREHARRTGGDILDLGCGSGRLLRPLLEGGAGRVIGLDGAPALLRRAAARIAADPLLAVAAAAGRLRLVEGDARRPPLRGRFGLVASAGVLPHLDGPEEALRMLGWVRDHLTTGGRLVIDLLGPGGLPSRDMPLSVDWERRVDGRSVVRRSRITRREAPEGVRVAYATITDALQADGTIARLPASYRLWYPSQSVLEHLVTEADLAVVATFGSHDLDPLGPGSERCIVIARRAEGPAHPATGPGRRTGR